MHAPSRLTNFTIRHVLRACCVFDAEFHESRLLPLKFMITGNVLFHLNSGPKANVYVTPVVNLFATHINSFLKIHTFR